MAVFLYFGKKKAQTNHLLVVYIHRLTQTIMLTPRAHLACGSSPGTRGQAFDFSLRMFEVTPVPKKTAVPGLRLVKPALRRANPRRAKLDWKCRGNFSESEQIPDQGPGKTQRGFRRRVSTDDHPWLSFRRKPESGASVKLVGKGLNSGQVHEPVLNANQLALLKATPEKEPFDEDPKTATEVRFIEVKGRSAVGEVALTTNEYKTAERLKDDYWLYVVFNCASTPEIHLIRDPVRLGWEPIVRIEHYHVGAEKILNFWHLSKSSKSSLHFF